MPAVPGTSNNAICIAPGVYVANQIQYPLLAVSTNGGRNWFLSDFNFTNSETNH